MQYLVYAIVGVCCSRCYLLIMAWSDREQSLNIVFLGDGRVEDEKERDERVHHDKLGLQRIPCVSQFTIPDTAGTSSDPVCNTTNTSSSQPN